MNLIILVDMDGPMAGFDDAFHAHCDENDYERHAVPCDEHRFATDCIVDPHHKRAARRHVDTSRWFRDLPATPGALAGINAMLEHPDVADVFLCTKPMEANRTCRDDKADWVERHLGTDWVRRLIITPDKGMVRGDVLLDDAPKSQWFDRAEWTPVIFPTSWNQPDSVWSRRERCDDAPRWDWSMPVNDLVWIAHEHRYSRVTL